jgi:hypothetical protein
MSVYGIGATYGGTEDKSEDFVRNGVACIGWPPEDAPAAHAQMKGIKAGTSFSSNPMLQVQVCTSRPSVWSPTRPSEG